MKKPPKNPVVLHKNPVINGLNDTFQHVSYTINGNDGAVFPSKSINNITFATATDSSPNEDQDLLTKLNSYLKHAFAAIEETTDIFGLKNLTTTVSQENQSISINGQTLLIINNEMSRIIVPNRNNSQTGYFNLNTKMAHNNALYYAGWRLGQNILHGTQELNKPAALIL